MRIFCIFEVGVLLQTDSISEAESYCNQNNQKKSVYKAANR